MHLIRNTEAEADGLTFEDKKSQAPAFPHTNQLPTNTDILGEAQTFATHVRGQREGEKKIIWKDISHQFNCFPQADLEAALSQLWITKPPELRETGKARVFSCTHLTFPLFQQDQRNFSFFCATTGGKVPAPKLQSVIKITETTNKPRDKYLFVSTQKCVWLIQLMSEWTIIWLVV